jgi:carbamoyl-phosphate synthase large subunit
MNILVSGASGIVGYGILRSLKKSTTQLNLIGTSIYEDSVAQGFCDTFELAPLTADDTYVDWLLDTIRKYQIDLIIPGIEADMYKWIDYVPKIKSCNALPLLNNIDLIRLCKDKWKFYENLNQSVIPCVIPSSLNDNFEHLKAEFGIPFLLKPRQGFGSKGIVRIDCENTFFQHRQNIGDVLMAQPIVGNDEEEFTTSAFCDGKGGFYAVMTLKRKLSKDGFTEKAEVVDSKPFKETIQKLCERFEPIGATNFQFRKCGNEIKLLEINPRISSSTSIRTAFGYNESLMSVNCFLKNELPIQPQIQRGKAVRYTDEHIFYENGIYF